MAVSKHPVLSRSNERVRICDGQTLIYAALFSRRAFKGTFRARIYYTRDDWQDIKNPFKAICAGVENFHLSGIHRRWLSR